MRTQKRKIFQSRRLAGIAACVLAAALAVSGCALGKSEDECPYEKFIVVDVFDTQANFQGIQSGWFAKIVKDKFNMELNIIAPNVARGGDTLYEMRVAAGDLGDLIIGGADNGLLEEMVDAGLLLDMSDYIKGKQIMQYETAIKELNSLVSSDGIYAIPSELSNNLPTKPGESVEPTFGVYLRWDLYAEMGYPEVATLEDLLPLLKKMREMVPSGETGNHTYAFSLFKDWDGNLMNAAKQPACLYGYDEVGFVLAKADGSDYQSIIDDDSLYVRALRFYFEANQLGLVDPDSAIQSYDTVFEKYQNGDVLFGIWPWLAQSAYNTLSHKEEGKGFMLVPVSDMEIFSYGCRVTGNSRVAIGVGSEAEDPQRLVDFIDWLYSPEGIMINNAQRSGGTAGPEGLTWEMTEDGPVLTDFGVQALMNGEVEMPEEWGGGTWSNGISELNFKSVIQSDLSPDGFPYAYQLWDNVREMEQTSLDQDWQAYMGAETAMDYLIQNNKLLIAPGSDSPRTSEDSEISTKRSQCKNIIVDSSWKMIFAQNKEEFDAMLQEMQHTVKSLGYDEVLKVDMNNALEQQNERERLVEKYSWQ